MIDRRKCLIAGVTALSVMVPWTASAVLAAPVPSFQGLGSLYGGDSRAYGVSADGLTVVGQSDGEAFRWTGGMEGLGTLGRTYSAAYGVSADGSVVVGESYSGFPGSGNAFRYDGYMEDLPNLPGESYSAAYGCSADGLVAVGASNPDSFAEEAVRWADASVEGLGFLGGGVPRSAAYGVSANGWTVVGTSTSDFSQWKQAFRWTGPGSMQQLTWSTEVDSTALGVSADGSTAVGATEGIGVYGEAFRWRYGALELLGHLPGGSISVANDASYDGSTIVGISDSVLYGGDRAFIWDEDHGMRDLQTLLENAGLDLTGWELENAMGVSDDGLTITGYGVHNFNTEAWIVTIPEPAALSLLALGALLVGRRRR